jgi:DNA-binding transcriptional MocR family regulator
MSSASAAPRRASARLAGRPAGVPLYLKIAGELRQRIDRGQLRPGQRLPSVRAQAAALGVNRMTVAHAYRALAADGLVRAAGSGGTRVAAAAAPPRPATPLVWSGLGDTLPLVEALEAEPWRERITFERAIPDPSLTRLEPLQAAIAASLNKEGRALLGSGPAEGHPELRRAVTALLAQRGMTCRPEEVLIVSGVQQGLDLILRAFCEAGQNAVLDDPAYYRSLLLFRHHRLHLLGLPVTAGRAALLEGLLAERPVRLIYTVSTFHNPTGRSETRAERLRFLEAARQRPAPVVEDDSLWELRYDGEPLPPLAALDPERRVLHLGSFSKILAPGLRLGWIVAPTEALRHLARVKEIADLRGNLILQAAVARLVLNGGLEEHLQRARRVYRRRRDVMAEAIERHFPKGASWQQPQGGLSFWVELPEGCDTRRLLERALERDVSFCPGSLFSVHGGGERSLRLAFGHLEARDIERGIRILGALAREEAARAGSSSAAARARAHPAAAADPLF